MAGLSDIFTTALETEKLTPSKNQQNQLLIRNSICVERFLLAMCFGESRTAAFALAAACALPSHAAVISTSGTLPDLPAGAYTLFNFNVTTPGTTTFLLAGDTDAYLGVFSGTNVLDNSTYIAQNDDSGGGLNSFLNLNLGAGSYTAWITSHGSYWDIGANAINFHHDHTPMSYTLTIDGDVSANAVPEPASLALFWLLLQPPQEGVIRQFPHSPAAAGLRGRRCLALAYLALVRGLSRP